MSHCADVLSCAVLYCVAGRLEEEELREGAHRLCRVLADLFQLQDTCRAELS